MSASTADIILGAALALLPLSAGAWYVLFSRRWAKPAEFQTAYFELGKMYDEMLNKSWELRSENARLRAEVSRLEGRVVELVEEVSSLMAQKEANVEALPVLCDQGWRHHV